MNTRLFIAWFEREHDILAAVRAARARGWRIRDTYTPYAVHGLDRASGLRRSRLPYICLAFALLGATAKLWFQIWTSAGDWPVNVGGKPFASVPAFVPVTFEITVLFAGLGTVLAFLIRSKLRPGAAPRLMPERVTDDRFAIVVDQHDARFDAREADRFFRSLHAVDTAEHVPNATPPGSPRQGNLALNIVLLVVGVAAVVSVLALRARPEERALEFLPGMYATVPADAYDPSTIFADGKTLQPLPTGTVRYGDSRPHYASTTDDALRAGTELVNPFPSTDLAALRRGAEVFATFCAVCHGGEGLGDGVAAQRGAPRPPSLTGDRALAMRDGQLFHIITYGQNLMASYAVQIPPADRWKAVLHIRSLQAKAAALAASIPAAASATPAQAAHTSAPAEPGGDR